MLYIQNEKWLAIYTLILHLIFHFSGLQAWTCRRYEFVADEIKIDKVQKSCRIHGSTINDMESLDLQNVINALKQNLNKDSYWTGRSWHSRGNGFFRYRNATLSTSELQSLVELLDSWICFVVRRNTTRVIPEHCDEFRYFLCKGDGHPPNIKSFPGRKCNTSELQNTCKMLFGNEMKGVKLRDAELRGDKKYWTALSVHKFCWNQDANLSASVNVQWWFSFILRNETSHLVASICITKHKYICELRNGEGTFSSQNITMEQQSLATSMTSSSSPLSSSSSYSSLSSSLLRSSSSLSTTKKIINTTPAQLSKTSKTSTVNLSNGFTTPPTSVKSSELAMGVATEQQNLATAMASSLSSSPTLSLPSSSLSSSLTTTAIKKAATKLLKTAITSTVKLSKKVKTPSSSEKTWLSVNAMTSSIVDSIEPSSPSLTLKSSKGSNLMGKHQNEAIEKINNLNVTNKGSLKDAAEAIQKLFHDLNDTNDGKGTVNVLVATQALESFAFEYAKTHLKKNESIILVEEKYEMKIQRLATNNLDPLVFPVNKTTEQLDEDQVGIALPPEVLKGKDFAIFIIFNDISRFVPELPALELRNRIISAKVYPSPQGTLQENVTISFGRKKKEKDKSHCVFWNFTIRSAVNGDWSRKGCSLKKSDDNKIICTCNHLTNFAVLMQVVENEVTSKHLVAMEIITYVGCALSLTAETLTIIAYWTLTDFKQEQVQIRLNLVVALAAAQLGFLSGIDALEPKGLCIFVAALIHFFYLVGFAWMFFEGVYLYLMVVKVFNTEIRLRAFYSVAWGCPAGIVVLSLVLAACQEGGLHSYIHGAFCWVSFSNNLIWTFVAPVLLVCVANAVLLSLVIREILKMQGGKAPNAEKLRQAAKACVVLSPLLGMTWVFGILSVTNASLVFQYIFTILNSLQGFFIFLLHVLRNADVRAEFKRKKRMWFEMRGRVAELHSSVRWTSEAMRSDVFELKDKYSVSSSHLSSRKKDQIVPFQEPLPSVECN
ncbi:adhesion G protein-coupled receptor L3-like [Acropora muricata]|uniref:adhesion G protein-coupled receptor L3-like n=1 Tax=Acropora muricata TaxID=159855 RepID=UPI0034E43C2E